MLSTSLAGIVSAQVYAAKVVLATIKTVYTQVVWLNLTGAAYLNVQLAVMHTAVNGHSWRNASTGRDLTVTFI